MLRASKHHSILGMISFVHRYIMYLLNWPRGLIGYLFFFLDSLFRAPWVYLTSFDFPSHIPLSIVCFTIEPLLFIWAQKRSNSYFLLTRALKFSQQIGGWSCLQKMPHCHPLNLHLLSRSFLTALLSFLRVPVIHGPSYVTLMAGIEHRPGWIAVSKELAVPLTPSKKM